MNDAMFDWQDKAACRNLPVEMFYLDEHHGSGDRDIKKICRTCPVRVACSIFGLAEDHGHWGGVSPDARKQWRKQLNVAAWMRTNGAESRFERYQPWLRQVFTDARRMGVKSALVSNTPDRSRTLAWLRSLEAA